MTLLLHRVFPWEPSAESGAPYAPDHIPLRQGSGRFDLGNGAVLYLGESPEHPVAESLQGFRRRPFRGSMLRRFGHPLALVQVEVPGDVASGIVNLDDPAQLLRFGLAPSGVASDDRTRTIGIAATIYESGATGHRWWSRLCGDWHGVVLFLARAPMSRLLFGAPESLVPTHAAVVAACRQLGIARF